MSSKKVQWWSINNPTKVNEVDLATAKKWMKSEFLMSRIHIVDKESVAAAPDVKKQIRVAKVVVPKEAQEVIKKSPKKEK